MSVPRAELQQLEAEGDALEREPIGSRAQLEAWLARRSHLESRLQAIEIRIELAWSVAMTDPALDAEWRELTQDVLPRWEERFHRLSKHAVDATAGMPWVWDRLETIHNEALAQARTWVPENRAVQQDLAQREKELKRAFAARAAEREAAKKASDDPAERWRIDARLRTQNGEAVFEELVAIYRLRGQLALNTGFPNFVQYHFAKSARVYYDETTCDRWAETVRKIFVPAMREVDALLGGHETPRPWVSTHRRIAPGWSSPQELGDAFARIAGDTHPELGSLFARMRREELVDLGSSSEARTQGAFHEMIDLEGKPILFVTLQGGWMDLKSMVHEFGHCTHSMKSSTHPYFRFRRPRPETAEAAAISLEYLSIDRWRSAFPDEVSMVRARIALLERMLSLPPWIVSVDRFQRELFKRSASHREVSELWIGLDEDFGVRRDWSGFEEARGIQWQRQRHIFFTPMFFIAYLFAYLTALSLRYRSKDEDVWPQYFEMLSLGASRPLPEVFASVGVSLLPDEAELSRMVAALVEELRTLHGRERTLS